MWVITQTGFYSAVQSSKDRNTLVVRTRVRSDAETLALHVYGLAGYKEQVKDDEGTDYPYRVYVSRQAWNAFLEDSVQDLEYDNFKNQVALVQGKERAKIYGNVWGNLWYLTRLESRTTSP